MIFIKIKDGFVKRKINEKNIIIPRGENQKDINGIIEVNDTAIFMWKLLETNITVDSLINEVILHYNIEREIANKAVISFISILEKNHILEDV